MEMHIECKITVNVPRVRLQKLVQVFTEFKLTAENEMRG